MQAVFLRNCTASSVEFERVARTLFGTFASVTISGMVASTKPIMVAINLRYVAELAGAGRLGFVATNGIQDYLVIEGEREDEYRQRINEGWKVTEIRPICRSINPKLIHSHPELQKARAFSYSLVILEHPALAAREAAERGQTPPTTAATTAKRDVSSGRLTS